MLFLLLVKLLVVELVNNDIQGSCTDNVASFPCLRGKSHSRAFIHEHLEKIADQKLKRDLAWNERCWATLILGLEIESLRRKTKKKKTKKKPSLLQLSLGQLLHLALRLQPKEAIRQCAEHPALRFHPWLAFGGGSDLWFVFFTSHLPSQCSVLRTNNQRTASWWKDSQVKKKKKDLFENQRQTCSRTHQNWANNRTQLFKRHSVQVRCSSNILNKKRKKNIKTRQNKNNTDENTLKMKQTYWRQVRCALGIEFTSEWMEWSKCSSSSWIFSASLNKTYISGGIIDKGSSRNHSNNTAANLLLSKGKKKKKESSIKKVPHKKNSHVWVLFARNHA